MEEQFPETIDQAAELGFKAVPKSGAGIGPSGVEAMKKFDLDKGDTEVSGTRNCQNLQPGDWCFRGFLGDELIVIFCDENHQCRQRFSKKKGAVAPP